jgi:ribosomal protein L11
MNCRVVLNFEAGNVDFVKLAKSLSPWKIKRLIMIKKSIDEKTQVYKQKFGNVRVPIVFFFKEKLSVAQINFDRVEYKIKTPYTFDLIKFYAKNNSITESDIINIAKIKLEDLNVYTLNDACMMIKNACINHNISII